MPYFLLPGSNPSVKRTPTAKLALGSKDRRRLACMRSRMSRSPATLQPWPSTRAAAALRRVPRRSPITRSCAPPRLGHRPLGWIKTSDKIRASV